MERGLSWDEGIRYNDLPGGQIRVANADDPIEGLHTLAVDFRWIIETTAPARLVAVLARERCQAGCRPTQVDL